MAKETSCTTGQIPCAVLTNGKWTSLLNFWSTDTHLSGQISRLMSEHLLETVHRMEACSCSWWWGHQQSLSHNVDLTFGILGWRSSRNWKEPLPITFCLNPWDIKQVADFLREPHFNGIAMIQDISDLSQVPPRKFVWLRLIPKGVHKGIYLLEIPWVGGKWEE